MANRTRTNRNEVYLDDKEQFILEAKFKESKMRSKSAFLRKLILFGFVLLIRFAILFRLLLIRPNSVL